MDGAEVGNFHLQWKRYTTESTQPVHTHGICNMNDLTRGLRLIAQDSPLKEDFSAELFQWKR